jgi:thymidylate kinase
MRKTFTVALIGGDGAGKTSVAKHLLASLPLQMKYMYMGIATASSKFALPTSRLVYILKSRKSKNQKTRTAKENTAHNPPPQEYGRIKRGQLWTMLRNVNRLLEAWYRQIFVLIYQIQGNSVIFDRHFLFDAALGAVYETGAERNWPDEIYYWTLKTFYPKPDLVIFLDAPAEMLYERKQESTLEYLSRCRDIYRNEGKHVNSFITVDVSQPLDAVSQDVENHVMAFSTSNNVGKYKAPTE